MTTATVPIQPLVLTQVTMGSIVSKKAALECLIVNVTSMDNAMGMQKNAYVMTAGMDRDVRRQTARGSQTAATTVSHLSLAI